MRSLAISLLVSFFLLPSCKIKAQQLYLGADMSYVNEMEDCGVIYLKDGQEEDAFDILNNEGGNIVRLRLWHTPSWYDALNEGRRYSDLADVKKSIRRVKNTGMTTLLDFHLSDNWADPSKQLVPAAWLDVVDDIEILSDSLYNYFYSTLESLNQDGLLPEIVQIGNETNKGILLSPEDNQGWTLDWTRNARLFNTAINAINDFNAANNIDVKKMIHAAGPQDTEWLIDGFISSGVTDFDYIGISYYWAWHKPTTINEAGEIISRLKQEYPAYNVMVVETGYIWTTEWNDNAGNIISEVHPDYAPASPDAQYRWLDDLTQAIRDAGGVGLIYWEPFWVSSSCSTQWGQGSHQEHATFFDFENNLIKEGGIKWLGNSYLTSTENVVVDKSDVQVLVNTHTSLIKLKMGAQYVNSDLKLAVFNTQGQTVYNTNLDLYDGAYIDTQIMSSGLYNIVILDKVQAIFRHKWMRIVD